MTLESAQVDIVFSQGVDTKTNPLVLPAGKFRTLDNFELNRRGEISLRAGFGDTGLTTSGQWAGVASHTGSPLFIEERPSMRRTLVSSGGGRLEMYGPPASIFPVSAEQSASLNHPDCCVVDDTMYIVWEARAFPGQVPSVHAASVDTSTSKVKTSARVSAEGKVPRAVVWQGRPWCLYLVPADKNIIAKPLVGSGTRTLFTSTADPIAEEAILTYDAAVTGDGLDLYLAVTETFQYQHPLFGWVTSHKTSTFRCTPSDVSLIADSEIDDTGPVAVAVWGTSARPKVAVATLGSGGVRCQWFTAAGPTRAVVQLASAQMSRHNNLIGICNESEDPDVDTVQVVWDDAYTTNAASAGKDQLVWRQAPDGTIVRSLRDARMHSRPFRYFGVLHCLVTNLDGSTHALIELNSYNGPGVFSVHNATPLAVVLPGEGAGNYHIWDKRWVIDDGWRDDIWSQTRRIPTSVHAIGDHHLVTTVQQTAGIYGPSERRGAITGVQFDRNAPCTHTELDGVTLFGGGLVSSFDGQSVVPIGFVFAPKAMSASAVHDPDLELPGLDAGRYSYVGVFEWLDVLGRLHRSPVSEEAAVDVPADKNTVRLTLVPPALVPAAQRGATQGVFRTLANLTSYLRLPPEWDGTPEASTRYWDDSLPDSGLRGQEAIYTAGDVLEAVMPPSARVVHAHRRRVWLAGCENPRQVWYSREVLPREAPYFNEGLVLNFPEPVTALGTLGEALAVFSRTKIWLLFGDGPSDAGTDDTFMPPMLLMSDVGCIEPRSVCATPMGLMFQSSAGIYLLGQDRSVQYIGAPVEELLREYPTITSAVLIADKGQVRFTANGPAGARIVVYYYQLDQWGTMSFAAMPGSPDSLLGAALVDGRYYLARKSFYGQSILREEPQSRHDNGAEIVGTVETGWLRFDSLQRLKRVRRLSVLGEGEGSVNVQLAVDDVDTVVQEREFPIQSSRRPRMMMQLGRQKLQSLKVKMVVRANAGLRLTGMSFEVGLKKKVWARGGTIEPKN